jgi:hypothetical protein
MMFADFPKTGIQEVARRSYGQLEYPMSMYTADVLRNVVALRSEIANLRDLNDRYASQQDPAPMASRANEERRSRLQEIVRELAALAKDQRP